MSPTKQIEALAQSVYLTIKNRYYDDIESVDGQVYVSQIIDHAGMYVDELENIVDTDGQLVDWWFNRSSEYALGTATQDAASITIPTAIDRLITDEMRYVQVQQDGIVISNWAVVAPRDITNKNDRITEDMCAVVGTNLLFSRPFRETEASGSIVGDVVLKLPRLSTVNAKLITQVRPKQLLILGIAKNITLPDIVQGKLSPSFIQKYNDLLAGAIARSKASSVANEAARDSFGYIRGV
ncbi:MAG: hypothetical protein ACR2FM_04925 [Candidatus Saccharimonadales bacterium]